MPNLQVTNNLGATNQYVSDGTNNSKLSLGTGNVGIGTTNPGELFTVQASNSVISVRNGGGTLAARMLVNPTGDDGRLQIFDGGVVKVDLKSNGDSHLSGGKLGVGTSSPGCPFEVRSSSDTVGMKYTKTGSKDARIQLGDPGKNWSLSVGWATQGDLSIIEEGVAGDRFYIKQGGNVGIGTTNPATKLHVNGTATISGNATLASNVAVGSNMGIGTSSPAARLELKGANSFVASGTVSITQNSETVNGSGTSFTSQVKIGDAVSIEGSSGYQEIRQVVSIASNTQLTVDVPFYTSSSGKSMGVYPCLMRLNDNSGNPKVFVSPAPVSGDVDPYQGDIGLDVDAHFIRIRRACDTTNNSVGAPGRIGWSTSTGNRLWVCVAKNTWRSVSLST